MNWSDGGSRGDNHDSVSAPRIHKYEHRYNNRRQICGSLTPYESALYTSRSSGNWKHGGRVYNVSSAGLLCFDSSCC